MRSGASGAVCLEASFAVSAMRARDCQLYWALFIIAPSVNMLRRTRRKPSTIRGAAPDVVIGQSTAARAGAHPYRAPAKWLGPIHSDSEIEIALARVEDGLAILEGARLGECAERGEVDGIQMGVAGGVCGTD